MIDDKKWALSKCSIVDEQKWSAEDRVFLLDGGLKLLKDDCRFLLQRLTEDAQNARKDLSELSLAYLIQRLEMHQDKVKQMIEDIERLEYEYGEGILL